MRIYKTKWFARFARKERICDDALREAIVDAEQGLIDVKLGGDLIKLRVARPGGGKSGGYRTFDRVSNETAGRLSLRFCEERA